jgi:uncharacterized membrane protein YfcA
MAKETVGLEQGAHGRDTFLRTVCVRTIVSPSLPLLIFLTAVILVAGTVNGLAGFGFAVIGTMTFATVIDPATAVVFMILPIFAVNLRLVSELSTEQLRTCGTRFGPLILSALVGTVLGMLVLDFLPEAPLRVGLGVVSLAFVLTVQERIPIPGLDRAKEGCFVESNAGMIGVGGVSGLLFGGTNVGVQLVAYVRSCDLSHGLFVGVVALVFLGLNGIRVGVAGLMGFYPSVTVLVASAGAAAPAVFGVAVGGRFRERVSERARRAMVLSLLIVIGFQLIRTGLGIF